MALVILMIKLTQGSVFRELQMFFLPGFKSLFEHR